MKSNRIVIFDSGAGGISVTSEILNAMPWLNVDYVADVDGFPYGVMDDDELKHRVISIIKHLISTHGEPALVVIACNTASTVVLHSLRAHFSAIEFVGVVPAIKPAVSISASGVIGMLATSATVARPYTKELIRKYANDNKVIAYGSEVLVALAEGFARDESPEQTLIDAEIENFMALPDAHKIDTMVLACTHFPLIDEQIKAALDIRNIRLVDSGEAIARRVYSLLSHLEQNTETTASIVRVFVSQHEQDAQTSRHYARCLQSRLHGEVTVETGQLNVSL